MMKGIMGEIYFLVLKIDTSLFKYFFKRCDFFNMLQRDMKSFCILFYDNDIVGKILP